LFLESEDPDKDIQLYINSPGGVVTAGLAIYDTMQYVRCNVSTICVGQAASMGAVLLGAGMKGRRFVLPHSRIMIHQPLGRRRGQATDIEIQAREIRHIRTSSPTSWSRAPARTEKQLAKGHRARFSTWARNKPKEYGIIDEIFEHKKKVEKS